MLIAAESKREEEKAKGVSTDDAPDNPDIVLFEDNEEDEEEESEEEEDGMMVQSAQGRGRGRGGMMWQPNMPLARGARPLIRGFPPVMMGPDGFGYPDAFNTPDLFGVPRGMFPPYGPRFPGDFGGAGMMFPGRPPQPGVFPMGGLGGMMMGNAGPRGPFMGGGMGGLAAMNGLARPGRPMGVSSFSHPQPPLSNRMVKRDQMQKRPTTGDRDEQPLAVGNGGGGQNEKFGSRSGIQQNDESESEDEAAPRRSRYGEGKKKHRDSEGEATAVSDQWETTPSEVQNQ